MEKARCNTELYSNLRRPLNNVKPSNFWGSHHFLRFFIPGFRSYPRIKQSRIPTRYGVAYFPICLYSIEAFKRMYFITYPVVGIHRNLVLTGADCQSPECQEQNVKVNAFPISVILYPKLFYERVLKSISF